MKIAFFLANLGSGGAERVTCILANYLSNAGHNVIIITLLQCKSAYVLNKNIRVIAVSNQTKRDKSSIKSIIHHLCRLKAYKQCIRTEAPDVIISMLNVPIYISLMCKKELRIPVIISERGDPYTLYSNKGIHSFMVNKLYPKSDLIIFQTLMASDYFNNISPERKIVIPNPLTEYFKNYNLFYGERKNEIVAVGRLNSAKNYPMLLKAFSNLCLPEKPQLMIYGEGELENELKALANELNILNSVHFMGFCKNVLDKIASSACYILSSDHEGMPNALMEALALGLPCISTDCPSGAPRMLIKDGENGLLVPVGDDKALSDAITKIFTNWNKAEQYGMNAYIKMKAYLPDEICAKWSEVILAKAKSPKATTKQK